MRMFIVSVLVLGALGFGLYRWKPVRTHVKNVLLGPPEQTEDLQAVAAAAKAEQAAQQSEDEQSATEGAQASAAE